MLRLKVQSCRWYEIFYSCISLLANRTAETWVLYFSLSNELANAISYKNKKINPNLGGEIDVQK